MGFKFSARSEKNLEGVHPAMVAVADRALKITKVDFAVIDGLRTQKQQAEHVKNGKSKTQNSRHLTGHAIDVAAFVNGQISWDYKYYEKIAEAFKTAALELRIPIVWGGDWKTFKDAGHFELDRRKYPS